MGDQEPRAILAVDDDPETLAYVRATLEAEGFSVATAPGVEAARRALREQEFPLILTDLRLGHASGLDLVTFAREHSPLTVGVVMTAFGTGDTALQALREGAFDFVLKPFPPEVLLASVRRGLEHHGLKRDLVAKSRQLDFVQRQLRRNATLLEDLSHEFKNPLSVVFGYSSHLLKQQIQKCPPADLHQGLRSIHTNAERLAALLDDLLDCVRLANRKLELDRKPLSAWSLVEEAVTDRLPEAGRRRVSLAAAGQDPGLSVGADRRRIQQVLGNLLSNALKFTPPGGRVQAGVEASAEGVRFWVRDTGPGIAPAELSHIFERFYRAGRSADEPGGLGLGLEISKALVELHGGRIWAESSPGQGAAFFFTLPLETRQPA